MEALSAPRHSQNAQEEARENDLETKGEGCHCWDDESQGSGGIERSKRDAFPIADCEDGATDPRNDEDGPDEQTYFEGDEGEDVVELRVAGTEAFRYGEDVSEDSETHRLEPQDDGCGAVEQRVATWLPRRLVRFVT